jgi:predicted acetyltransferase
MLPNLDLIPAGEDQRAVLANMLELYTYEFSELLPLELGDDGRFGYKRLDLYWTDARRQAFLVRCENRLAGLVLIKRGSEIAANQAGNEEVWDMAEFFILRRYRRRGIGAEVAAKVWRWCPGLWEVRVRVANTAAVQFWNSAVARFTGEQARSVRLEIGGQAWHVLSFESKPLRS